MSLDIPLTQRNALRSKFEQRTIMKGANMLKDEWEVRDYILPLIWGKTGLWDELGLYSLKTVSLIKLALALGCRI